MDKTRNKIFVGCLALLLVMVVGYALFSQSLNITGTATAKGDFSVTPTCEKGIPANLLESAKEIEGGWFGEENGYYDDSCTVSGNAINYQSGLKWPGARRYFTVKVKNTGSVTALLSYDSEDVEFCNDANENDTFDADECTTDLSIFYLKPIDHADFDANGNPVAIEDKSGKIFTTYNMTEEDLSKFVWTDSTDSDNQYIKLEPGESMYFVTSLGVNSEIGTDNGGKMNFRASYSTKLIFTQPTTK